MKKSLFTGIACVALVCGHAIAGNYTLTIDGEKHEVDLDKQTTIKLADGKSIEVKLEKKAIVSFKIAVLSFDHPSTVAPSRTDLGDGIHQTMMTTPLGTMVLIQEYADLDPGSLVDLMLNELTKEEKQYGYMITNSAADMKLTSGKTLTGKKSVATYKGAITTRHVMVYSARDAGIMVVTQTFNDAPPEDKAMIETFWKTFEISLK